MDYINKTLLLLLFIHCPQDLDPDRQEPIDGADEKEVSLIFFIVYAFLTLVDASVWNVALSSYLNADSNLRLSSALTCINLFPPSVQSQNANHPPVIAQDPIARCSGSLYCDQLDD